MKNTLFLTFATLALATSATFAINTSIPEEPKTDMMHHRPMHGECVIATGTNASGATVTGCIKPMHGMHTGDNNTGKHDMMKGMMHDMMKSCMSASGATMSGCAMSGCMSMSGATASGCAMMIEMMNKKHELRQDIKDARHEIQDKKEEIKAKKEEIKTIKKAAKPLKRKIRKATQPATTTK